MWNNTFGTDSTLETPVYSVGTRNGATLQGDLVLVGSGDGIDTFPLTAKVLTQIQQHG